MRPIYEKYFTGSIYNSNGPKKTIRSTLVSMVQETKDLGTLCLIDIDKEKQLEQNYRLNSSPHIVTKFFEHIDKSYAQIENLDKSNYRQARRLALLTWLLDDYIDYGGFTNPICAFLNDRYFVNEDGEYYPGDEDNDYPFWISCPGSTREVIEFAFGAKPTFRALAFVPHSYKLDDITIFRKFTDGDELVDYLTEQSLNPKQMSMRAQAYETKNFGVTFQPNYVSHVDDDDQIKRKLYWDIISAFYLNNNIHFSYGKDRRYRDNLDIEHLSHDINTADISIHFKDPDAHLDVLKVLLTLPLLHKHPKLLDLLAHNDRIAIRKIKLRS